MKNFNPSYYANARREIEPLLPENISSVLEIGCSEGNTLMWLRDRKSFKTCCGIEMLPDVAARAKEKGLDIVVADIERDGIPFKEQYDLVLCLDVLEHLHDPWNLLKDIAKSIKPNGYLIASVPNVGHISVLLDLALQDDWHYAEAGILDRTHLRFFTGTTARQLLTGAGLEVIKQKPRFARKTHRRLNYLTLGLFQRFFTFQHLFLAIRKDKVEP
jgi:2-polyprenyl-3-methyl-5-hydroxy-6-metoxy-1,4-benzoquinol methylase